MGVPQPQIVGTEAVIMGIDAQTKVFAIALETVMNQPATWDFSPEVQARYLAHALILYMTETPLLGRLNASRLNHLHDLLARHVQEFKAE